MSTTQRDGFPNGTYFNFNYITGMKLTKKQQLRALIATLVIVIGGVAVTVAIILYRINYAEIPEESIAVNTDDVESEEPLEYIDYYNPGFAYTFKYPAGWNVVNYSVDTEGVLGRMWIDIENPEQNFIIGLESSFNTGIPADPSLSCEVRMDCGGESELPDLGFDLNEFEEFITLDGIPIYIAKKGAFVGGIFDDEPYAETRDASVMYSPSLTQIRAGKLTWDLYVFGLDEEGEGLNVYCSFETEEGATNWPEYKEIFRTFAASIKPVDQN